MTASAFPDHVRHRFAWDLRYKNEPRRLAVPAGWPGAAVTLAASRGTGTPTAAIAVRRWTPLGAFEFASAKSLDLTATDTASASLSAEETAGVAEIVLVNTAAQSGVVIDVEVRIERIGQTR